MRTIMLALLLMIQWNTNAQPPSPLMVVQQQLDAYNRQDVAAFAALFATDAQLFNRLGDSLPSITGRAAIASRYSSLFQQYPQNTSTLLGRMQQGNIVIDQEYITGRDTPLQLTAIYEVKNGFITRCWFIK